MKAISSKPASPRLAIETDHFSRDDIYTLFVTTRIVNFLKGLPVDGVTSLPELMRQRWSEPRSQIGFDLLKQLVRNPALILRDQSRFAGE